MTHRLRAAAALTLLAAACTATPPPATPTPTPTLTCLGTGPTPSPFPCDDNTRAQEKKALEDEAKAVYARYWKEYTRLLEAGGANEATPELKATVAEPALADLVALLRFQSQKGLTPTPFQASLLTEIRSAPVKNDAEVSIIACEDTRGSVFKDPSGTVGGSGVLNVQISALRRSDGHLKIYYNEEAPAPCPVG